MFSCNNIVKNNIISNFAVGIAIGSVSGNIISGNLISSIYSHDAILIYRSKDNLIINNEISSSIRGITLTNYSTMNTVKGNQIYEGSYENNKPRLGILVQYSSDKNKLTNNNISDLPYGIIIREAKANSIYNNNFIDNTLQAYDDSSNNWSFEGHGNYWSDYRGNDASGNGIGDIRYCIGPLIAEDRYPRTSEIHLVKASFSEPETLEPRTIPNKVEVINELRFENQEIGLDKSYKVTPGASLVIDNSTLKSVGNVDEPYELYIENGGNLTIKNSKLIGSQTGSSSIYINAEPNSLIHIKNSEFHQVDAMLHAPGPAGPSLPAPNNAVIENNIIIGSDVGVDKSVDVGTGIEGAKILNNTIVNSFRKSIAYGLPSSLGKNLIQGNIIHDTVLKPTTKFISINVKKDQATFKFKINIPGQTSWFGWRTGDRRSNYNFKSNNKFAGIYDSVKAYFQYRKLGNNVWMNTDPVSFEVPKDNNDVIKLQSHNETIYGLHPNTHYEFRAVIKYNNTIFNGRNYGFITNDSKNDDRIMYVEPDIKVNGSNYPITISSKNDVSITLGLDYHGYVSQNADWWIATYTSSGWKSFVIKENTFVWEDGVKRCIEMSFVEFASLKIPQPPLSKGKNTIFFAVDDNADGKPDATWWDSVEVNVE